MALTFNRRNAKSVSACGTISIQPALFVCCCVGIEPGGALPGDSNTGREGTVQVLSDMAAEGRARGAGTVMGGVEGRERGLHAH